MRLPIYIETSSNDECSNDCAFLYVNTAGLDGFCVLFSETLWPLSETVYTRCPRCTKFDETERQPLSESDE